MLSCLGVGSMNANLQVDYGGSTPGISTAMGPERSSQALADHRACNIANLWEGLQSLNWNVKI